MYYLRKKNYFECFVRLILLSICTFLIFYFLNNYFLNFLNKHLIIIYTPFQRITSYTKNGILTLANFNKNVNILSAENTQLKIQNQNLKNNISSLEYLSLENETLKRLMNMNFVDTKSKIYASVIANDLNSNFIIDKGVDSGLKENMTVITELGLVGKIKKVNSDNSTVELITNCEGISARIISTNEIVLLKGIKKSNELKCIYIPLESKIKEGDLLKTIDNSSYHTNIFIGEVEEISISKDGTSKEAYIRTSNNFSTLDKVIIII